jgi:hypothetical protein
VLLAGRELPKVTVEVGKDRFLNPKVLTKRALVGGECLKWFRQDAGKSRLGSHGVQGTVGIRRQESFDDSLVPATIIIPEKIAEIVVGNDSFLPSELQETMQMAPFFDDDASLHTCAPMAKPCGNQKYIDREGPRLGRWLTQ